MDKFVQQDHVAGGRYGQPLGDAFNDAEQYGFNNFQQNKNLLIHNNTFLFYHKYKK